MLWAYAFYFHVFVALWQAGVGIYYFIFIHFFICLFSFSTAWIPVRSYTYAHVHESLTSALTCIRTLAYIR